MEKMPLQKKVYRMKPPFLLIIPIVFVLIIIPVEIVVMKYVIPIVQSIQDAEFLILFILFIVSHFFVLSYMFVLFVLVATPRLEFSKEGVIFYSSDYYIFTPWQNIAGVGTSSLSSKEPIKTLELKEPASVLKSLHGKRARGQAVIKSRMKFYPVSSKGLKKNSKKIPLWIISQKQWEEGNLLRELQHYAPHINVLISEEE